MQSHSSCCCCQTERESLEPSPLALCEPDHALLYCLLHHTTHQATPVCTTPHRHRQHNNPRAAPCCHHILTGAAPASPGPGTATPEPLPCLDEHLRRAGRHCRCLEKHHLITHPTSSHGVARARVAHGWRGRRLPMQGLRRGTHCHCHFVLYIAHDR